MIRFSPNQPLFSAIEFPAYKGLVENRIQNGYNPINENNKLELGIMSVYSIKEFMGDKEWIIGSCEITFTITRSQGELILPLYIINAVQHTIQALRDRLNQETDVPLALRHIPPYPLEQDNNLVKECFRVLNK